MTVLDALTLERMEFIVAFYHGPVGNEIGTPEALERRIKALDDFQRMPNHLKYEILDDIMYQIWATGRQHEFQRAFTKYQKG